MSVVQTKESTNGGCPRCEHLHSSSDILGNLIGELTDGVMWMFCLNCREELTVTITLTQEEALS